MRSSNAAKSCHTGQLDHPVEGNVFGEASDWLSSHLAPNSLRQKLISTSKWPYRESLIGIYIVEEAP